MPSLPIVLAVTSLVLVTTLVSFMAYVVIQYSGIVARIFEEKPLFLPLRVARPDDGEEVQFATRDGMNLAGTYLKTRSARRAGVLIFCHEFLGNRWSVLPYLDHLRDHGFDLFTFDFRNHGDSDRDARYNPLQWVSDHEIRDLHAALGYLRSRPDADPAGYGFFGVSRGGGAALCVASQERGAWGVITDGAFPTRSTVVAYIHRWAEIYVRSQWFWNLAPTPLFEYLGWTGRMRTQFRTGSRYPSVERAVARLTPRPWLAIHGQKDAYIGVAIAEKFVGRASEPKELWIVPQAKHNRCREKAPELYAARLVQFFERYAPRRVTHPDVTEPVTSQGRESNFVAGVADFESVSIPQEISIPLPG